MSRHGMRVLGHPVHPILTAFPLGLWTTSVLWDMIALVRLEPIWGVLAFWSLAAGVVGSVPVIVTGFLDYLALPDDERVQRIATWHMMAGLTATSCFTVSLLLRHFQESQELSWPALLFSGAGLLALLAAGWWGGELVFGYAIGVRKTPADGDPPPSSD